MFQSLLNSATVPILEKVAVFGERRNEVLAGNLANIDTPNYRSRDLPVDAFQEALKAAVAGDRPQSLGTATGSSMTADQAFPRELFRAAEAAANNITFQDGGNRSIEHEVMELTKNSMLQGFALNVMTAQLKMMEAVIREQP
jgi:flagellar basal-body rod protein FlgB